MKQSCLKQSMRNFALLTWLCCFVSQPALAANPISVWDSWVREAPPTSRVSAAYMQIKNDSPRARTLLRATSKQFARIEMHESYEEQGIAKMRERADIIIAAHAQIAFQPGGLHFMLFEPNQRFTAGDKINLILHFDDGLEIPIVAPVKRAAQLDHSQHHH